jgi:hypothetical protein
MFNTPPSKAALPQSVLIPTWAFFEAVNLLRAIDPQALPEDMRHLYTEIKEEFEQKKKRIRNRVAYADIPAAKNKPPAERAAANENYQKTKSLPIGL